MSKHDNGGSHYENHRRAAELHDIAAHAHRTGAQQGHQDHLSDHEQSRQALEQSRTAHEHTRGATAGHVIASGHKEIATRAYELWQARGCPPGSPEEDWFHAAEELRSHSYAD